MTARRRFDRAKARKVLTPARLLVYLGVFTNGHALGHFANGNTYWGVVSVLVGAAAFVLAVMVAG